MAEDLDRHLRGRAAPKVVVVASDETRAELEPLLTQAVRGAVIGWTHAEAHAGPSDLLEVATPVLEHWRAGAERAIVERWAEATGRSGRAVSGWHDTLEAASDGRVDMLLFNEGADHPGWQCPACGRVGVDSGACPLDGTAMEHSDAGLRSGRAPDARPRRHGVGRPARAGLRAGRRNRRIAAVLTHRPFRESDVAAAGGRTLRVAEYGDADGVPIVYCHGTPGSRLDRVPDPAVYAGYRFVSYDRPGYGESSPDQGRNVAAVAADVAAIAATLGIERFGVFGVSGGGPHAIACGGLVGERVTRIAVRCGVAPLDDPEFDPLAGMAEVNIAEVTEARKGEEASAALLDPQAAALAADPLAAIAEMTKEVPEADKRHLARPEVREVVAESLAESVRQGARGWIDDDIAFVSAWGFDLADVGVEVRLWQGELDVLVPRSHAEYLARKLPRATFELVPGHGHWMADHFPVSLAWLANGA